jgi:hypothetical protein
MDGATIFLSHSAKDPEAALALPSLANRLEQAGLVPWYDKVRLELPGFTWRAEIDHGLQLSRAAVLVLSPSALESDWVRYEAAVLSFRSRIAPHFRLIPLLLDGVTLERLGAAAWDPMNLTAIQATVADDRETKERAVVEALAGLAERFSATSYERRLENDVVEELRVLGPGSLGTVAAHLEMKPASFETDLPTAVARRLLEVPLPVQFEALSLIAGTEKGRDVAITVHDLVAPHGWIEERAARQVRDTVARPAGERALGINTINMDSCSMHVHSGHHLWDACEIEGQLPEEDVDELVRRVRGVLLQCVEYVGGESFDDPQLDEEIRGRVNLEMPFLVLPADAGFPEALDRIFSTWPHLPVLLRIDPDRFAAVRLPHVAPLDPPVEPIAETTALDAYAKHCRRLSGRRRRT